ncbi:MAG: DUF1501 domain-containing protein, partial [Pirellulaceae bacterium]
MNDETNRLEQSTRRAFFSQAGLSIGSVGLTSLIGGRSQAAGATSESNGILPQPHHTPKAKAVIYLFMAGGPSQLELFDDKPTLRKLSGKPTPASYLDGRRFAFLKGNEKLLGANHKFGR